jgi:hypothetical protein
VPEERADLPLPRSVIHFLMAVHSYVLPQGDTTGCRMTWGDMQGHSSNQGLWEHGWGRYHVHSASCSAQIRKCDPEGECNVHLKTCGASCQSRLSHQHHMLRHTLAALWPRCC